MLSASCSGYLSVWELFSTDIQPFTAYAPFMTIDGNHERDYPQSGAPSNTHCRGQVAHVPAQPFLPVWTTPLHGAVREGIQAAVLYRLGTACLVRRSPDQHLYM